MKEDALASGSGELETILANAVVQDEDFNEFPEYRVIE